MDGAAGLKQWRKITEFMEFMFKNYIVCMNSVRRSG